MLPGEFVSIDCPEVSCSESEKKYLYPISIVNQPGFVTFWVKILKDLEVSGDDGGFQPIPEESVTEDQDRNDELYYQINEQYISNIQSNLSINFFTQIFF